MSRSCWVSDEIMEKILMVMAPENRLAIEVSLATGLRIDDVLGLKTEVVKKTYRPTVVDKKTHKSHRIYLPVELRQRMLAQAGQVYIWPGRNDPDCKHRTRQAVYKDMQRAVDIMRHASWVSKPKKGETISPHSARKCAAVRAYKSKGFDAARAMLQHDKGHPAVTLLYILSDQPDILRSSRSRAKSSKRPHIGH